jgi:hypothetical protein
MSESTFPGLAARAVRRSRTVGQGVSKGTFEMAAKHPATACAHPLAPVLLNLTV